MGFSDSELSEKDETIIKRPNFSAEKCASTSSKAKSQFVKMASSKSKKKKQPFAQLSFVEKHVDTFYSDPYKNQPRTALNPVKAKQIGVDEWQEALGKDWIRPDSQLVRTNKQNALKKLINQCSSKTRAQNKKLKELTFAEDIRNEEAEKTPEQSEKKSGLFASLFDDLNSTVLDNNLTLLSPSKYRIYVEDTPVQLYGLSVHERRKTELNN